MWSIRCGQPRSESRSRTVPRARVQLVVLAVLSAAALSVNLARWQSCALVATTVMIPIAVLLHEGPAALRLLLLLPDRARPGRRCVTDRVNQPPRDPALSAPPVPPLPNRR